MPDDLGTSLIISSWPLLLTTEMASQFLSLDKERFLELVRHNKIDTVDAGGDQVRWHRHDIEKVISKLPKIDFQSLVKSMPRMRSLDDATIEKLRLRWPFACKEPVKHGCPSWCHFVTLARLSAWGDPQSID